MHIRDYLHDIPLRALKAIARALDVSVEYEARIKLINAIDRAFWDGTLVQHLLKRLSAEHHCLLSLIAFSYDAGIDDKRLLKKAEQLISTPRQTKQSIIDDLMVYALVGCIREEGNRYFCPHEIAEQVRAAFLQPALIPADESKPVPPASAPNLLEDIFSLLALIDKQEISLTLLGNIKKSVFEKALTGSQTSTGPGGPFGEDLHHAFLVNYLKTRELVVFDRRSAHTTELLSGWLDLSMTERCQDIVAFILTSQLQDEYAIIALNGILSETDAGKGLIPEQFAAFLHGSTMATGGTGRLETRIGTVLHAFSQLGLLAKSGDACIMTRTGERFFRNESLPIDENISGDFSVQPNFEVIVGPEIDPRIRFSLELMSERKNRDTVHTFVITPEGIGKARERGMSVEGIIAFFRDHSRNEVPQNVLFSIKSWAKEYGAIYFEDVFLMRFRNPTVCDSVARMPEVVPYIREHISDTVLVIKREYVERITKIAREAGFQPENYGEPIPDHSHSGAKFIPTTIGKIIDQYRLPEFYSDFAFPEHFDGGEGES